MAENYEGKEIVDYILSCLPTIEKEAERVPAMKPHVEDIRTRLMQVGDLLSEKHAAKVEEEKKKVDDTPKIAE